MKKRVGGREVEGSKVRLRTRGEREVAGWMFEERERGRGVEGPRQCYRRRKETWIETHK